MRHEFPKRVKVAAWARAEGRCEHIDADGERCNKKLHAGDINYDHVLADGLGGTPTLDNCEVLCKAHHDLKTFTHDVPRIAKTKRVHARHIGADKPRGWGNPNHKRQIGGGVVDRRTGEPVGGRR